MQDNSKYISQDTVFLNGEGDQWFSRNKTVLAEKATNADDPIVRVLELANIEPCKVLEVGASNGYRLQKLRSNFGCRATAVEPSQMAIDDGQARYPEIRFLRGTAANIPVREDEKFDLVIVNFVLHWIDRANLLKSIAEIDRVVADGGYLIVGDFYPASPEKTVYHHLPEENVWTYKQEYPKIFLSSNIYSQIASVAFDYCSLSIAGDTDPAQRTIVSLLRKSLSGGYKTSTLS